MKIATWNLDHATESWRQEAICSKLTDINADIFILTETRDSISPGEAFTCVARSSSSKELKEDESWVTIWSRLPVIEKELPTTDSEFTAAATVSLPDRTPLVIFGTVLPWRGRKWIDRERKEYPSAGAVAFKAALGAQQEDWRSLAREQSAALCIAGDFNQDLSKKHYYWSHKAQGWLQAALDDCELSAMTSDVAKINNPTDPVRELTNGAAACIDHICLSQAIEGRQIGRSRAWSPVVDGRVLSDHPGVWIKLLDGTSDGCDASAGLVNQNSVV